MRVTIMMRDEEYREALARMISDTGRDVFVEISGSGTSKKDSVILTDVMPDEIEQKSLVRLRDRTVFLSPVPVGSKTDNGYHIRFKYSCFADILSELLSVYAAWSGDRGAVSPVTRMIAVISGSDQLCSDRCRSLAGQIVYVHGGSLLILPLGYINDYRTDAGDDSSGSFRRLMYMIDEDREYHADAFTMTDSYGITTLRLPGGINPLAELDSTYLSRLINSLGRHFDTVILDIGSCYRKENIGLIYRSDNILFLGSNRRTGDLKDYIGEDNAARAVIISCADSKDEAVALDGYVRDIYGDASEKENDS